MKTSRTVVTIAEHAVPLMAPCARTEAEQVIASLTANADDPLAVHRRKGAAAWEHDMQPVSTALAAALHARSLATLRGLRNVLPGLMRKVNRDSSMNRALVRTMALNLRTANAVAVNDESAPSIPSTASRPSAPMKAQLAPKENEVTRIFKNLSPDLQAQIFEELAV